ncbi:hypothetical protein B5X24_HaOG204071 [Helicoverpa armigera]|uniref:Uncharacterized protein n=1 Tax=Helicoverpa armigera TaxID=29058 RepID=A0A2W1BW06_HELAM|nr:hypothetical protein B5X24_HaOG204071 [Helicoverpa armigera]
MALQHHQLLKCTAHTHSPEPELYRVCEESMFSAGWRAPGRSNATRTVFTTIVGTVAGSWSEIARRRWEAAKPTAASSRVPPGRAAAPPRPMPSILRIPSHTFKRT